MPSKKSVQRKSKKSKKSSKPKVEIKDQVQVVYPIIKDSRFVARSTRLLHVLSMELLFVQDSGEYERTIKNIFREVNRLRELRGEPPYEEREFFYNETLNMLMCSKCLHEQMES